MSPRPREKLARRAHTPSKNCWGTLSSGTAGTAVAVAVAARTHTQHSHSWAPANPLCVLLIHSTLPITRQQRHGIAQAIRHLSFHSLVNVLKAGYSTITEAAAASSFSDAPKCCDSTNMHLSCSNQHHQRTAVETVAVKLAAGHPRSPAPSLSFSSLLPLPSACTTAASLRHGARARRNREITPASRDIPPFYTCHLSNSRPVPD